MTSESLGQPQRMAPASWENDLRINGDSKYDSDVAKSDDHQRLDGTR